MALEAAAGGPRTKINAETPSNNQIRSCEVQLEKLYLDYVTKQVQVQVRGQTRKRKVQGQVQVQEQVQLQE